jgi:hypothetical protein
MLLEFDFREQDWKEYKTDVVLFSKLDAIHAVEDLIVCVSCGCLSLLRPTLNEDKVELVREILVQDSLLDHKAGILVRIDPSQKIVVACSTLALRVYSINDSKLEFESETIISDTIDKMEFLSSTIPILLVQQDFGIQIYTIQRDFSFKKVAIIHLNSELVFMIPLKCNPNRFLVLTTDTILYFDLSIVSHNNSFNTELQPSYESKFEWDCADHNNSIQSYICRPISDSTELVYLSTKSGDICRCKVSLDYPSISLNVVGKCGFSVQQLFVKEARKTYLLALGYYSEQGLFSIEEDTLLPLSPPKLLFNSYPLSDICAGNPISSSYSNDSLYVGCGEKSNGNIQEIHNLICPKNIYSTTEYHGAIRVWGFNVNGLEIMNFVLMLSYPSSTRLVHAMGNELIDVSDISGINQENSTLFACSLSDNTIVQIQPNRLAISLVESYGDSIKAKAVKSYKPKRGIITFASTISDFVVMSLSEPNCILVLKLLTDVDSGIININLVSEVELNYEVSCIFLRTICGCDPVCIVGTYESSIHVILFDDLLEGIATGTVIHTIEPVHYLECIKNSPFIVAGTKGGKIYSCTWYKNQLQVQDAASIEIGDLIHQLKQYQEDKLIVFCKPRPLLLEIVNNELVSRRIRSTVVVDGTPFDPVSGGWIFITSTSMCCYTMDLESKLLSFPKPLGTVFVFDIESGENCF